MNKKEVRKRFNERCRGRDMVCRVCNATDNLEVHHITNRNEMPNGGYVPENGITLCPAHHLLAEQGVIPVQAQYAMINSNYEKAWKSSTALGLTLDR